MSNPNCFQKIAQRINSTLEGFFQKWGKLAYRYSYAFFVFSVLLIPALGYGFFIYEETDDGNAVWVPEDTQAVENRDLVEDTFKSSPNVALFYIVSKQNNQLLTYECFNQIWDFDQKYKQQVAYDGQKYEDFCYKATDESQCNSKNHPLEFWEVSTGLYDLSGYSNTQQILAKINTGRGPLTYPNEFINVENIFSDYFPEENVTNPDGTNNLKTATAARWTIFLQNKRDKDWYEELKSYEIDLEDFVEQYNKQNSFIDIYYFAATGYDRELESSMDNDLGLIQVGVTLIIVWSLLSLSKLHPIQSRTWVGFAGVVSVVFAYIEAVGMGAYFGIEGTSVVQVLPFLLMGIGVDDMYVLIFTLDRAPKELSGEEKIKFMMRHAGVSITITSITNIFSFSMGSLTSIPAIKWFCQYAALGMFFDYLNQITFFLVCVCWDQMRQDRNCGDSCGLCMCKPDSSFFCKGKFSLDEKGEMRQSRLRVFFRDYYSKIFNYFWVRIGIILAFLILISVNIYGATQLKLKFDVEWFVGSGSHISDAIDIRDKYYKNRGRDVRVYIFETQFQLEENQLKLENLEQKFDECYDCDKTWIVPNSSYFWYSNFKGWIEGGKCINNNQTIRLTQNQLVPSTEFYPCLRQWIITQEGSRFTTNLAWKTDNSELEAVSISFEMKRLVETDDQIQAMFDTRDICDTFGPGDSFPYNFNYLFFEQFNIFEAEVALSLGLSCGMVFLIVIFMTTDIISSALVFLMVGQVTLAILAILYFWDEELNFISITNIIIGIGISVDNSVHIAQAFRESEAKEPGKRLALAFDKAGLSVFNGGVSTLLAIIPLAVAESYVFTIFFKAWLVIVLFGTGNAIILLPCCLYFLSPWIKLLHNEVPVEKSDQLENNEDNNPINEGVEIK